MPHTNGKSPFWAGLSEFLPPWAFEDDARIQSLVHGGSIRKFFRIVNGDRSAVLMDSSALPDDFARFISIREDLEREGVPVPGALSVDPERRKVLLEDLGDTTLYSIAKAARNKGSLIPHYKHALEGLLRMQRSERLAGIEREFDFKGLRWETDYFYNQFILRHCGISPEGRDLLFREFDHLAERLARLPRLFTHRDFQSQNIMVLPRGVCFLDFQGARRGNPYYDVVSLLRDPYVRLPEDIEQRLLEFYAERANNAPWFDKENFHSLIDLAGIQRHSQALGAFSYLSLELKKEQFIPHIRPCWEYLEGELASNGGFPRFLDLVRLAEPLGHGR